MQDYKTSYHTQLRTDTNTIQNEREECGELLRARLKMRLSGAGARRTARSSRGRERVGATAGVQLGRERVGTAVGVQPGPRAGGCRLGCSTGVASSLSSVALASRSSTRVQGNCWVFFPLPFQSLRLPFK